jgi:hypothetical protein
MGWTNNVTTETKFIDTTRSNKMFPSCWTACKVKLALHRPVGDHCGHQQQHFGTTDVFQLFRTIPSYSFYTWCILQCIFVYAFYLWYKVFKLSCLCDKIYYLLTFPCVRLIGSDFCQYVQTYIPDPIHPCCMSIFLCYSHNWNACNKLHIMKQTCVGVLNYWW